MTTLWEWNLRQFARRIWVPIAAYGLVGLLAALAAALVPSFLPADWTGVLGENAVTTILQIVASSMLAVTTFSVSIMLSAFGSAASGATPRATSLLREDPVTQSVLATFMGAFIFSLVSIIGLESNLYRSEGRLLIFGVTLLVLTAIVVQLVRWIGHLSNYGRMVDTIERVEEAATKALEQRTARPFLGGRQLDAAGRVHTAEGHPVLADSTGYVQLIEMQRLQEAAEQAGVTIAVLALPGAFVHPGKALALIVVDNGHALPDPQALLGSVRAAFAVAATRTFEQDPRFGLLALTEIASRALSPAVNDPGTAIDILGRQLRVLSGWTADADTEVAFPRILVPGLSLDDMICDAFDAIARDGAGLIEVQVRLQKMLEGLVRQAPQVFGPAAVVQSQRALQLAEAALVLEDDKDRLRRLSASLQVLARGP
jgi:uncharacterized membrane protein